MEALRIASAGAQSLCSLESSLPARKSVSTAPVGSSSAGHLNRLSCGPLGLWDGLSSGVRRSKRFSMNAASSPSTSASSSSSSRQNVGRVARLTSPPRSTAALAPEVENLEGSYSVKDIDTPEDLEAETASLVHECSDLDWKKLVDDLRSEALHGLQSSGLRALSLKALEKLMDSWLHDQMADGIEIPMAEMIPTEEAGWSLEAATCELRTQANLQVNVLIEPCCYCRVV
jgi:hypothetical protein